MSFLGSGLLGRGHHGDTNEALVLSQSSATEGALVTLTLSGAGSLATATAVELFYNGVSKGTLTAAPWTFGFVANDPVVSGAIHAVVTPPTGPNITAGPSTFTTNAIGAALVGTIGTLNNDVTVNARVYVTDPVYDGSPHTTSLSFYWGPPSTGVLMGTDSTASGSPGAYQVVWDKSGQPLEVRRVWIRRTTAAGNVDTDTTVDYSTATTSRKWLRTMDFVGTTGTWPGEFYHPDGTGNSADVELIGSGGGGSNNVGAAGGGEHRRKKVTGKTPGGTYTVVLGAVAANANGADSTFDTTDVVAKGGLSGANGSAGGTGGTGDSGRNGGAGQSGTGPKTGGGAGGSVSAGSSTAPGDSEPGFGTTSIGGRYGGGGGSTNGTETAGQKGYCAVNLMVPPTALYAFESAPGTWGRDAAVDATSHALTLPTGDVGDLLIAAFAGDGGSGSSTTMPGDWTAFTQANNGTAVSLRVFWRVADNSTETTTVTTSVAEQGAWRVWRIKHGGTPQSATAATGTGAGANPPSITFSSSGKHLVLAIVAIESSASAGAGINTFTSGYVNVVSIDRKSAVSALLGTCQTEIDGASADPAAYGNASAAWAATTIAVPYAP